MYKFPSQGAQETIEEVGGMLVDKLPAFVQSGDLEVQERVSFPPLLVFNFISFDPLPVFNLIFL